MPGSVLRALPVVSDVTIIATLQDWHYYFTCCTNEKTERLTDSLSKPTRSQGRDSKPNLNPRSSLSLLDFAALLFIS